MSHKTTVANNSKISATSVTEKSPANPLNRAISFTFIPALHICDSVHTHDALPEVSGFLLKTKQVVRFVLQMTGHKNEAASG